MSTPPSGTIGGALIGGGLGSLIGGGTGQVVATVVGAVGGGYAGNQLSQRSHDGRLADRGSLRRRHARDGPADRAAELARSAIACA